MNEVILWPFSEIMLNGNKDGIKRADGYFSSHFCSENLNKDTYKHIKFKIYS